MSLIVAGIAINAAITFFCFGEYPVLTAILGILVAISAVGAVLIALNVRKPGALLTIIGSCAFVPIGFIAVIGARRVLDQLAQEELEARRAAKP